MNRIILMAGVYSGILMALTMSVTFPLINMLGVDNAEIVLYICKMLSFLPIFFGVRSFRDNVTEGSIAFTKATAMAMVAMCIAIVFYVVTWLIIYYGLPEQMAKFGTDAIAQLKAAGKSQQEIDTAIKQLHDSQEMLKNPLSNATVTFTAQLPMGLLFSLITGLLVKKQTNKPLSL